MDADVAVGPVQNFVAFVGRNQEGKSASGIAFVASALLGVGSLVLDGSASPLPDYVLWPLLMLQWHRRVVKGRTMVEAWDWRHGDSGAW